MDKQKEIEAMTAEIQYAMDIVREKNKTTIAAEALAWYLIERKDYHKADEVRKETMKSMALYLIEKMGNAPLSDIELVKMYAIQNGVEVEE